MKRQTRDKSLRKGNSLEKNEWDKAERLTWQLLKSHEKVAMKCKNAVCLQGIIWCHCFTLTIHQHSFNLLHFYAQKQLHTGKGREGNMKLQYAPQTEHFAIGCLNNQCTTISFFITPYIWVCSHPLLPEDVNAWENGERLKDYGAVLWEICTTGTTTVRLCQDSESGGGEERKGEVEVTINLQRFWIMIQPEMEVGQEEYLITVISFVLSTSSVWGLVWTNTCYLNTSDYCKKDLFKQCKYQRRHCRIDLVD